MSGSLFQKGMFLKGDDKPLKVRLVSIYSFLILFNIAIWVWAFIAFHNHPILLGTAFLAYGFGLRHAVDADHIAAIDNVTRKLMQEGQRPVAVGFFFSLGHSTVVILAVAGLSLAAYFFKSHLDLMGSVGNIVGTFVSAFFLLIIALINVWIFINVYKSFRKAMEHGVYDEDSLTIIPQKGGIMTRIFGKLFKVVNNSRQMYPVGFLFGLGFDTATEVALLGISAMSVADGMVFWKVMALPALFTAGMSLIDTTDGVLMLGAYNWAFIKPIRKLYYNMTITFISVIVALVIGAIESLGVIAQELNIKGNVFWNSIAGLNNNWSLVGGCIIGIFVFGWLGSMLLYKLKRYDEKILLTSSATPE